ncbi:polysaccharide pyruvyl transferase family protein [Vibrio nomapromontoriensis]|uniref:polysaccharide pyruvyl transferase family protein n=1 Tax=Vibrio nomapromontoriensis TaxID=2910246 RepID=UPI003D0FBC33
MKKIVFINQHGSNKGDYAAFQSQLEIISVMHEGVLVNLTVVYNVTKCPFDIDEYKNIKITHMIDDTTSKLEKLYYRVATIFDVFNYLSPSKYITDVKLVVSQADEIYLANGGANLGVYTDWRYLWRLSIASVNNNLCSFGNSIGDSKSKLFDKLKFKVLRKFKSYLVRDLTSQEYLEKHNISCVPTLDVVYAQTSNLYDSGEKYDSNSKFVVFTPNELHNWHPDFEGNNLEEEYVRVINKLISRGLHVVLLPQLFSDNHISDEKFYLDLVSKCNEPSFCDVIPSDSSIQEQLAVISKCEYVIGGRYHSLVFALSQDKPVISLSYESKMSGMMRYFGLDEYSMNVSEFSFERLFELTDSLDREDSKFEVSNQAHKVVSKALSSL